MVRRVLEYCRYLFVVPIVGALILAFTVVIRGLVLILGTEWELVRTGEFSPDTAKQVTIAVIQSIDMFLVGAICYIVALGFYRLFISRDDSAHFRWIKIEKLSDLENKIIGMAVVALGILFLGKAVQSEQPQALLLDGIGIAVMISALCLFSRFSLADS
jgi:uncharacterized membrane protein YqhA